MRYTLDQHGTRIERIEEAQQRSELAQAGLQIRVALIVAGLGIVGNAIAIPLILKLIGG
jgi:hypothetical protein